MRHRQRKKTATHLRYHGQESHHQISHNARGDRGRPEILWLSYENGESYGFYCASAQMFRRLIMEEDERFGMAALICWLLLGQFRVDGP